MNSFEFNQRAKNLWNSFPVGSQRSNASPGTKKYFDDIKNYRYNYETPFIPRLFCFKQFKGKKVLEVGVGQGIDAVNMAELGAIYTGIDITERHLELLKKNFKINRLKSPALIYGDLLDANIQEKFNYIYSFGCLHHILHEESYLKKFHNLLTADGHLMIAVYSKYSFYNFYLILTYLFINRSKNTLDEWRSHCAELSPLESSVIIKIRSKRELVNILNRNGFKIIRYYKRGFVKKYLPFIGKYLSADGVILNMLGALLGWYHLVIATKK